MLTPIKPHEGKESVVQDAIPATVANKTNDNTTPETKRIEIVDGKAKVADLRPHPENVNIYGDKDSIADLVKHVEESGAGILEPVVITPPGEIISGHRRYRAAQELKLEEVPVRVFDSTDPLQILDLVVGLNSQRVKTGAQIAKEAEVRTRLRKQRRDQEKQQRAAAGENLPPEAKGKIRDEVAKDVGLSPRTVDKAVKTSNAIAKLRTEGKEEDAAEVEAALEKSIERGLKVAVDKGAVAKPKAKKKPGGKKGETEAAVTGGEPAGEAVTDAAPTSNANPEAADETPSEPTAPPEPATVTTPDTDSDDALTHADQVVTFLRSKSAKAMNDQQRRDWKKLLDQITTCRTALNL